MRQYLRLGILLILVADLTGCGEEERPKQTIEQLEKYAWFYDGWTNQDKNTNHITRVHLYYRDGGIYVHMWGRCGGGECDWGEAPVTMNEDGKTLNVVWALSYVVRRQQIQQLPDGSLEVTTHSEFSGTKRSPRTLVDRYERGMRYNWGAVAKKYFK